MIELQSALETLQKVIKLYNRPVAHEFLTPVDRTTLSSDICRKMVTHLIRGDWQPGERIPAERELCQQLGVGRASLREALKALEIMGMIETRVGDGTYAAERSNFLSRPLLWAIISSSESEAQELVDARTLIEVELVGLAAQRATTTDLAEIGKCLDKLEAAGSDLEKVQRADIAFHLAIADASHNNVLRHALLLIRNLLRHWIADTLQIEGAVAKTIAEHHQIFVAIAKKDELTARSAMQRHLRYLPSFLLEPSPSLVEPVMAERQDEFAPGK